MPEEEGTLRGVTGQIPHATDARKKKVKKNMMTMKR
jgi:hypothetical protein